MKRLIIPLALVAIVAGGVHAFASRHHQSRSEVAAQRTRTHRRIAKLATVTGAPASVEEQMAMRIEGQYQADTLTIDAAQVSTTARWADIEPVNAQGSAPAAPSATVYGFLISGTFTVHGPNACSSCTPTGIRYSSGRIVTDAEGHILSVDLWSNQAPPAANDTAVFGPQYDGGVH